MFANPIWSVALLVALLAVYVIVRIKHGGPLLDTNKNWFAWIFAFRSWIATFIAGIAVAVPDIVANLVSLDFTPFIGENYAKMVGGALAIFLAVNNAFKTKPDGIKAS